jgi:hypothetical protein
VGQAAFPGRRKLPVNTLKTTVRIAIWALLSTLAVLGHTTPVQSDSPFTFVVTADMRYYSGPEDYDTCEYFRGACEAINATGEGVFMISPGDIDPTVYTRWTITSTITNTLGTDYLWYPVVGNHELPNAGHESETGANMAWLRDYDYDTNGDGVPPDIVNLGPSGCPSTTFSFDYENAHFVLLNEYCDAGGDTVTNGDVTDHLYNWLADDLAATSNPFVFVFGHEPAYPQPDTDTGRVRHLGDSLDQYPANRDRFWNLLKSEEVTAYICGHTHNFSAARIDGVWQVDVGHARGRGDTGAPSTFVRVTVGNSVVAYEAYRVAPPNYCQYALTHQWGSGPTAVTVGSFAAEAGGLSSVVWPLCAVAAGLIAVASGMALVARRRLASG